MSQSKRRQAGNETAGFHKIIVIEDDQNLNHLISNSLKREGFAIESALTGEEGISKITGKKDEIILLDYKLPDLSGKALLSRLADKDMDVPFIIMTGYGDEKIAVEMMKRGALDYIVKEKDFIDLLISTVKRACTEINNRRKLEQAQKDLRESERQKNLILNSSLELIAYYDTDLQVIWTNKASAESIGKTPDELVGKHCYELWAGLNEPCQGCPVLKALEDKKPHVCDHQTPDGRYWYLRGYPILDEGGDVKALVEFGQDITSRKKTEEELKKSEDKYRRLVENSPDITYIYGSKSGALFWSNRVKDILGFPPEKLKQDPFLWQNSIHPEDINRVNEVVEKSIAGKEFNIEYRVKDIKGNWHWLQDRSISIHSQNGETIIEGLATDITKRKQAEEKIRESERKYRLLFESAEVLVSVYDKNGICQLMNPKLARLFGGEPAEFIGKSIEDLHTDKGKQYKQKIQEVIDSGIVREFEGEVSFPNKTRYLLSRVHPVKRNNENIARAQIISQDITERKKAEEEKEKLQEQLLQTQKLKSIGTLAGGVAHDFNNILTVIIGLSQLILSRTEKSDPNYDNLKNILSTAERAAKLTKQLLLFSRKQDMDFEIISINDTINRLKKMLNRLIGENIKMHNQLSEELWPIRADENQIEQVITNIVINARDAMPDGGKLTITTKNVIIKDNKSQSMPDIKPGKYIRLDIEDTGRGIEKEIQGKIFDPFFTTKGRAKGTGMGLSVVHGIIKKHKGQIKVKSETGRGTKFKIFIPAIDREISRSREPQKKKNLKKYQGQGETILIAEDDQPILKYLENIFSSYNYNFHKAGSGEEALDIFNREKDDIDLLISDVVMTGMNGVELADKLKEERPDLKVILSSGYSDRKIIKSKIKSRGYAFIRKPYNVNELLELIREILEH